MHKLNINTTGNRKLVNSDRVRFLIWNIPARVTCPYATPMCKRLCYAVKAEKLYPQVLPSRSQNFIDSRKLDFAENMIYTIDSIVNNPRSKAYANAEKIVVRIHESGDFYNQAYADAWLKVAEHFESDKRFVFMAYTKSLEFFKDRKIPSNMVIRFSIWDDTDPSQIALAESMNLPSYSADTADKVDEMVSTGYATKCDCRDCANCGKCWDRSISRIYCVIH